MGPYPGPFCFSGVLMERVVVFVDAGYVWAAAGQLTCGTMDRARIVCDYAGLTTAISTRAPYGQLLRLYWYDAATNATPTGDHLRIAELPYVKLRLGRLVANRQKGVDSLIYRDLTLLARNRAAAVAILVSGDDDLREAVIDAQECGMQIIVATIQHTGQPNAASALLREADDHIVLDQAFLSPYFTHRAPPAMRRPTGPIPIVVPPPALVPAATVPTTTIASPVSALPMTTPAPNAPLAVARQAAPPTVRPPIAAASPQPATPAHQQLVATSAETFAEEWMSKATASEMQTLVEGAPKIPRTLDMDLLRAVERQLGRPVGTDQLLRQSARMAFWAKVRKNKPIS
jgi:uncharacterized LabA/DUF88 family protein